MMYDCVTPDYMENHLEGIAHDKTALKMFIACLLTVTIFSSIP